MQGCRATTTVKPTTTYTSALRIFAPCLLFPLLLLWSLTGYSTPPPAGIAPVSLPTGGIAIDGDLLANTPAANVGDWLRMTNIASGTGGGVLNASGVPLNNLI